jgi:membrane fusion protein (multidrug efflux system)
VRSLIDGIIGMRECRWATGVAASCADDRLAHRSHQGWFAISEQEYLDVADRLRAATRPGASPSAKDWHSSSRWPTVSTFSHAGELLFANRQIDSLTGTLRVATSVSQSPQPAAAGPVRRLRAANAVEHNALLVPQACVAELQGTFQVMCSSRQHRERATGHARNARGFVVGIERGLTANQLVIVRSHRRFARGKVGRPYGQSSKRNRTDDGEILHQPAHRRDGDRAADGDRRYRDDFSSVAQYPSIVPPEIVVQANVRRRRCAHDRGGVRDTDRAEMSGVDNMNYMYPSTRTMESCTAT